MKKIIVTLFSVMMIFLSACGSTAEVSEAAPTTEKSSSVKETKSEKDLYKGAGLVIAVTAPEVRNGGKGESWMPQFFQDSITGNLAKYSKMTVLDRANEDLTKAEQELGETGFYTEENAVQLGQMTNAQYAVFGSITALSSSYELNFRAIAITTNEIKAAYNDRAGSKEIEDGTSVRAIVTELLDGLGIGLSEKEKAQLAKTDKKSLNATKSLAKGAAAEKADNLIEALAFYAEAQENGATNKEASAGINNILGTNGTVSGNAIANLKAQAEYEKQQVAKWQKILDALEKYFYMNQRIAVYDMSDIKMSLINDNTEMQCIIAPGIKVVPNRKTMLVVQQVLNEWNNIITDKKNDAWSKKVHINTYPINFDWSGRGESTVRFVQIWPEVQVLDNSGYKLKSKTYQVSSRDNLIIGYTGDPVGTPVNNIKSQKLYFSSTNYYPLRVITPLSEVSDDGDLQFEIVLPYTGGEKAYNGAYGVPVIVMSIDEYNDWVKDL